MNKALLLLAFILVALTSVQCGFFGLESSAQLTQSQTKPDPEASSAQISESEDVDEDDKLTQAEESDSQIDDSDSDSDDEETDKLAASAQIMGEETEEEDNGQMEEQEEQTGTKLAWTNHKAYRAACLDARDFSRGRPVFCLNTKKTWHIMFYDYKTFHVVYKNPWIISFKNAKKKVNFKKASFQKMFTKSVDYCGNTGHTNTVQQFTNCVGNQFYAYTRSKGVKCQIGVIGYPVHKGSDYDFEGGFTLYKNYYRRMNYKGYNIFVVVY